MNRATVKRALETLVANQRNHTSDMNGKKTHDRANEKKKRKNDINRTRATNTPLYDYYRPFSICFYFCSILRRPFPLHFIRAFFFSSYFLNCSMCVCEGRCAVYHIRYINSIYAWTNEWAACIVSKSILSFFFNLYLFELLYIQFIVFISVNYLLFCLILFSFFFFCHRRMNFNDIHLDAKIKMK